MKKDACVGKISSATECLHENVNKQINIQHIMHMDGARDMMPQNIMIFHFYFYSSLSQLLFCSSIYFFLTEEDDRESEKETAAAKQ